MSTEENAEEKPEIEVFFDWLISSRGERELLAQLRAAPPAEVMVYVAFSLSKLVSSVDYLGDRLSEISCDVEGLERNTRPDR